MSENEKSHSRLGWLGGAMLGSGGLILGLTESGAINKTTSFILMWIPIALMFAFFRAAVVARRSRNPASKAGMRYLSGIFVTSIAYMLGLGIAIWTWRNAEPSVAMTWFLAMLPIAPILGMIYVMGRYITEEQDEYLRERFVTASLIGLGFVLAAGSFYGFLETFELVPHVPGWWAVPVWAAGMGAGQGWLNWRDRAHDAEFDDGPEGHGA